MKNKRIICSVSNPQIKSSHLNMRNQNVRVSNTSYSPSLNFLSVENFDHGVILQPVECSQFLILFQPLYHFL